jgi:hypothetical protein
LLADKGGGGYKTPPSGTRLLLTRSEEMLFNIVDIRKGCAGGGVLK